MEKRKRAQTEKKTKLVNPLFFVSSTRLSIRNLARKITDDELHDLVVKGAKAGLEKGRVTVENIRRQLEAQAEDPLKIESVTTVSFDLLGLGSRLDLPYKLLRDRPFF